MSIGLLLLSVVVGWLFFLLRLSCPEATARPGYVASANGRCE